MGHLVRANALHVPLADESVDLIVTSPPFFALRSYRDDDEHIPGQLGAEPTPREFLEALWAVTAELWRVLRPGGSLFLNLGDKYTGSGGSNQSGISSASTLRGNGHVGGVGRGGPQKIKSTLRSAPDRYNQSPEVAPGIEARPKSLMLLPERYRIGCADGLAAPDGQQWIPREILVWSKPNGLPESVRDRCRRSHEDWVHLTKEGTYYAALDEIREPHEMRPQRRPGGRPVDETPRQGQPRQSWPTAERDELGVDGHPLGKLPPSVWTIPTEPLTGVPEHLPQHFAAFPTEWPRRLILAFSPPGICLECGEGRRPYGGTRCEECGELRPNQAKACPACGHVREWKAGRVASEDMNATDWSTAGHGTPRHPGGHVNRSETAGEVCGCNEPIPTPVGRGADPDPSRETGRGGFNRPRTEGGGQRITTRWAQRHWAREMSDSPHRAEMTAELGRPLDHHLKPSRASGRPLPPDVLERWLERGWLSEPPPFVPPPTRPSVVLDPFVGTGTVVAVAEALGRVGIGLDLSLDYLKLARWRVDESGLGSKIRERTNRRAQGQLL